MHELAIAEGILHSVLQAAGSTGKITRIRLRIGQMQHLKKESLQFAFDLISEDTLANGAQIEVTPIAALFRCNACETEFQMQEFVLICPSCNGVDLRLLKGDEIFLDSLDLESGVRIEKMDADMNAVLEQHMMEEHGDHFDTQHD